MFSFTLYLEHILVYSDYSDCPNTENRNIEIVKVGKLISS